MRAHGCSNLYSIWIKINVPEILVVRRDQQGNVGRLLVIGQSVGWMMVMVVVMVVQVGTLAGYTLTFSESRNL